MEELTLAERYQIARIEAESYRQEFLELEYENGEKSKVDRENFIEERAKSKSREHAYSVANAQRLIDSDIAEQMSMVARRISANEARLQSEFDSEKRRQILSLIEDDRAFRTMNYTELQQVMVSAAEMNRNRIAAEVKGELLVSELGLTGKQNYLTYKIDGLYNPVIIGNVEREDIPQLAEFIKDSEEFASLLKLSKVEPVLDFFRFHSIFEKTKLGKMADAKAKELEGNIKLGEFVSEFLFQDDLSRGVFDEDQSSEDGFGFDDATDEPSEKELLDAVEEAEASTPDDEPTWLPSDEDHLADVVDALEKNTTSPDAPTADDDVTTM